MVEDVIAEFMYAEDLRQPCNTLQHLAAVRVAIVLCESEDMQFLIGGFCKTPGNGGAVVFSNSQWRQIREKAMRKLNQIPVPDSCIKTVLENLWQISFEVNKWIHYHIEDTGINFSPKFCWTPLVMIDYVKTAEILVKDEALDIKKRYKLACVHCLEFDVRSLFDRMSLSERRLFFVRGNLRISNQNPIVLYWTYYIQEVDIDYWSSEALKYMRLFEYASENGYLSATKFFLGKIEPDFRDRLLFVYLHKLVTKLICGLENFKKDRLAIARFFVCEISDYAESTVVTSTSFLHFLEWPLQKYFMTVVNQESQHIGDSIFLIILIGIFEKDMMGFKDYNYQKLFKEFWHQSPEGHKIFTRIKGAGARIFMKFVKKRFGFIFEETSFDLKVKFRAAVLQQEIPEDETNFEKENVDFFKFLIREGVANKSLIHEAFHHPFRGYQYFPDLVEFFDLPLGELYFLIDGILLNV